MKLFLLTAALIGSLFACSSPRVPGGRIVIRNDILDKDYNTFTIDEVLTSAGRAEFRKTLRPGEQTVLSSKHVASLRFTRRYRDHSKVYIVTCPEEMNTEVTIKLIDVHTNRMGGGCVLSRRGELRQGVTTWEKD